MEEALIATLLASSGVSALVGARVYPGARPQGSILPALIFNRISGAPGYTTQGSDGLSESRVQIDAYASSYGATKALARATQGALSGLSGTRHGVVFQGVFMDSARDGFEGESPERIFRVSMDFTVWAVEP